jgi:hypothetical protein
MFCPACHDPNTTDRETCHTCGARLPERQGVHIGRQFVFLNADAGCPIAVCLDDEAPITVTKPTIVSRHRHTVAFGDAWGAPGARQSGLLHRLFGSRRRVRHYFPIPDQPRLEGPRLDLTAIVTERRVYHPDDEAHIFIVAPDLAGGELELEVHLAEQAILRERVALNAAGLALFPYADLEEGEYTVRARRSERQKWAECHFSVAEFTLSPLIATLDSHAYTDSVLRFELRLLQLSVPYTGDVELGLQCAACDDRVVLTAKCRVQDGRVRSEFDLSRHDGPFKIQVTTPQGETALVDLPGSGASERERIVINPLGRVAEASLLPGDDTQPVRGLHVGYGGTKASSLRLENAVAREACFVAARNCVAVQIVAQNPLSAESAVYEWRDVKRGDRLTLGVNAPFTLFTVAVAIRDSLYEGWATVIRPSDLNATLTAPDQAAPGDQITVTLSTTPSPQLPSTVHCLLLAYDARLEHPSPLPKLGQRQYQAIHNASVRLSDGPAPDATRIAPSDVFRGMTVATAQAPAARKGLFRVAQAAMEAPVYLSQPVTAAGVRPPLLVEEAVEAPPLQIPPTREDFPELAYLELFEFEGKAERVIPLGDQIGTWRCRAYFVSGLDVLELTADVQADKPLYAELDLPAIVAEGDEIEAGVTYHSDGPAEMLITLPGGETIQGMVMGHGTERFTLTGPGEVSAQLSAAAAQDWTTRTVQAPGVQTVTASRLKLLRAGETVSGQRVVVYPGISLVLTDTIEALLRYPFG